MDRLNFFQPYEHIPASHENQLTRALLVVLKYSPTAHSTWLSMIAPEHQLPNLPKAEFATQKKHIQIETSELSDDEWIRGLSVFLTPDKPDPEGMKGSVEDSDRKQILDGIVSYGSELVLVIENKVTSNADPYQALTITTHEMQVRFDPKPRALRWADLITAFVNLIELNLVAGAERLLVDDFLALVDEHFPQIGPYSLLSHCNGGRFRVERRLDAVIEQATGCDSGKARGWRNFQGTRTIFMAHLGYDDSPSKQITLSMYPGDTLGQSRALYGDPEAVDNVLALRQDGWAVEPNFHWGFMAPGYAWMDSGLETDAYCEYWVKNIGNTGQKTDSEWEIYWRKLQQEKVVLADGKQSFDEHFTLTDRKTASPRPGLKCLYTWNLDEAESLDSTGEFVVAVKAQINNMLAALHEPKLEDQLPA